jgi:hypothetical protein
MYIQQVFEILSASRATELVDLQIERTSSKSRLFTSSKISKQDVEAFFNDEQNNKAYEKMTSIIPKDDLLEEVSKLSSHLVTMMKNGKTWLSSLKNFASDIITATTFLWLNIESRSHSRDSKLLAKCAFVAKLNQALYRERLITQTSAGYLWIKICDALAAETDGLKRGKKTIFEWKFKDRIMVTDTANLPQAILNVDTIAARLEASESGQAVLKDHAELEKLIKYVEEMDVAKCNPREGTKMEENVWEALDNLVDVRLFCIEPVLPSQV